MPKANQVNSMIDTSLNDTREHLGTLSKAKDRPHVLDDATIDRVERVHTEQMNYVDIYTQQISRWRTEKPSAAQARELDRMEEQNQQLRGVTADVLALASQLQRHYRACLGDERPGTRPSIPSRQAIFRPRLSPPTTLRAIRYRALLRRWAFDPHLDLACQRSSSTYTSLRRSVFSASPG